MEDVCDLPNGCHLFRKPNEAGGYTYYSDEVGGGVMVWDTCLVGKETLLSAIVEEKRRAYLEYHINRRLVGANKIWDLLVKEIGASEKDRSEFLLWFKTSLPFYPQNLMVADKKQLSREFKFNEKLGSDIESKICFCDQMINAHIVCRRINKNLAFTNFNKRFSIEQIVYKINEELKLISC